MKKKNTSYGCTYTACLCPFNAGGLRQNLMILLPLREKFAYVNCSKMRLSLTINTENEQ